ncbi:hypothetical protein PENNAL_c0871G07798, partial [Penicillium nalgiovense]
EPDSQPKKNQDFGPHTPMCHGVPLLPAGLSLRDHGCRCHEPSDDRSASTTILAGGCCENMTTPQDRSASTTILAGGCCVNKTTSQDRSASPIILAGRCCGCVNKTTSQDRSASTTILAG